MSARYLIRLDDACPTMSHEKWALLERIFDRCRVKPIVAVIPDNQDPKLMVAARDEGFWDKVRAWEAKGWTVGMHGHTHVMNPTNSGLLLPYYKRSEFAGLTAETQSAKIRTAWELFLVEGITPSVWVAPAHSFDVLTLRALHEETSIRVVSDGIAWDTYYENDFHWVPQQLWGLAKRWSGLWTVCLHPNQMSDASIASLGEAISEHFRDQIIAFKDVELKIRSKSLLGRLYHEYFWWRWRSAARKS